MPWRTTFDNTVITPLPSDVHPGSIIALLHNHSYLIHTQPIVTRFSPQPQQPTSPSSDKNPGTTYDVWERIGILPFGVWTKEIHFTAGFRDTQVGVDSRVEAPMGFVSDATYVVRRREEGDERKIKKSNGSGSGRSSSESANNNNSNDSQNEEAVTGTAMRVVPGGESDWVIEEKIRSECAAILKPFIQGTMIPVRRKMHEGMIAHVRSEQERQAAVAWSRAENANANATAGVVRPAAVTSTAS